MVLGNAPPPKKEGYEPWAHGVVYKIQIGFPFIHAFLYLQQLETYSSRILGDTYITIPVITNSISMRPLDCMSNTMLGSEKVEDLGDLETATTIVGQEELLVLKLAEMVASGGKLVQGGTTRHQLLLFVVSLRRL